MSNSWYFIIRNQSLENFQYPGSGTEKNAKAKDVSKYCKGSRSVLPGGKVSEGSGTGYERTVVLVEELELTSK